MHELIHILEHSLKDTWMMFPLLFLAYFIIERFERKENKEDTLFKGLQKYGPLFGALIGIFPQCGFSIIASMLFLNNNITLGTLLSVFIATSDEALPILFSNPSLYSSILGILVIKIIVAILVGYICDKILYPKQKILLFSQMQEEEEGEITESSCPCCYIQYPIVVSALLRTLKIFIFLFITTVVLNFIIHALGEETLSMYLMKDHFIQPVFAALFGFIPNCAASVVLTQLYIANQVSFASLISGLISNAGLGLIVLIRYETNKKRIISVISILFISAVLCGFLLSIGM